MIAPTLQTARLTLRPATMADFAAYAAFLATDRSQYMGGPHGLAQAQRDLQSNGPMQDPQKQQPD